MGEMTRTQSLAMWKHIAEGIFNDHGSFDADGEYDPPGGNQIGVYHFIEEVAKAILEADNAPPKDRPKALMKALRLDGRTNDNDRALRRAISGAFIFPDLDENGNEIQLTLSEKMPIILANYRHQLGFKNSYEDTVGDDERIRQIRNCIINNPDLIKT